MPVRIPDEERGVVGDGEVEWDVEYDIRRHIEHCTCTCDHMGYGNYLDYQQHQHPGGGMRPSARCNGVSSAGGGMSTGGGRRGVGGVGGRRGGGLEMEEGGGVVVVTGGRVGGGGEEPMLGRCGATSSGGGGWGWGNWGRNRGREVSGAAAGPTIVAGSVSSSGVTSSGGTAGDSTDSTSLDEVRDTDKAVVVELSMQNACLAILLILMVSALGIALGVPLALRGPSDVPPSPSSPPAVIPPPPPSPDFPLPTTSPPSPFSSSEDRLLPVRRILSEVPLVDGHNDAAWNVRTFLRNQILNFDFSADLRKVEPWSQSNWSHTDLPRMREGMVGAQLWSAFVPCRSQHMDAVQIALEQIDVLRRLIYLHPQHLRLVTTSAEVWESHRLGRIASIIGIEGGHAIGNSLAILRSFYDLGVRLLTLTHACNTPWADCSSAGEVQAFGSSLPEDHQPGLSEFGKVVVHEMNRLGMVVDLAHTSFSTMREVLAVSQAPVVFSHTASHAICPTPRNLPDEILRLVAKNGGVVMISFYSHFLTCNETSTMDDVIAHINHIRSVAGIDHVGIGAGFDGIDHTPAGLEDVSRYPHLLARLINPADSTNRSNTSPTSSSTVLPQWDENDVKKLAGLNFLRVLAAVEEVRTRWKEKLVMESEQSLPEALLEGRSQCISSIAMLPENGHRTNQSVPQLPDAQWALP